MICLRCGYCCQTCTVVIVDDPEKGLVEGNLIAVNLLEIGRCKHLVGNKPGEFSCAVHNYSWYKETPCAHHGQIEHHVSNCRLGEYVLKNPGKFKLTRKKIKNNL